MTERLSITLATAAVFSLAAGAQQNATTNEKGATGAYSSSVESSYTSESRFGPKTAIDDLRADVDRDREQVERIRMQQLSRPEEPSRNIEPLIIGPPEAAEPEADREPETSE